MTNINSFGNKHTWFDVYAIQQTGDKSLHELLNIQYPVGVRFIERIG